MKEREKGFIYSRILAVLVFAVVFIMGTNLTGKEVYADRVFTEGGEDTWNVGEQEYFVCSSPVESYLLENDDHSYTRVETRSDKIIVEQYSKSFKFIKTIKEVPMELPRFGGFYAGKDANYFVFGQDNLKEKKSVEVYRVVKYSKSWKRLGDCGLYDCNTIVPFDAGSLRFAESGKMLYIRTCHQMYTSADGLNHQANLTMSVDTKAMRITDSYYGVSYVGKGYVSHSFNQFIKVNDKELLAVDHGDAYPRSVVLIRYEKHAGEEQFTGSCDHVNLLEFKGKIGENETGASVGGFEIGDGTYLVAGNNVNYRGVRNVFVSVTNQSDLNDTRLIYLTNYKERSASTPILVKVSDEKFLVLWTLTDQLGNGNTEDVFYVWIDQYGKKIGEIQSMKGRLSDCQPIVAHGKIVWYSTLGSTPIVCSMPADGSKPVNNAITGETYTIGKLTYRVLKNTKNTKTVSVEQAVDTKATKITVPAEVKIYNETFKVTEIGDRAFYYCFPLKSLTIGKNVRKIGAEMTYLWDSDVRTVVIKSKVLSEVGEDSFQGMKRCTIKVPKSRLAKYKKLLKNKGQQPKVKIIGY